MNINLKKLNELNNGLARVSTVGSVKKGSYDEIIKIYQASEDKAECIVNEQLYNASLEVKSTLEMYKESLNSFKARKENGMDIVAQPEKRFDYIVKNIFPAGTPDRGLKIMLATEKNIAYAFTEKGIDILVEKDSEGYGLIIEHNTRTHSITGVSATVGNMVLQKGYDDGGRIKNNKIGLDNTSFIQDIRENVVAECIGYIDTLETSILENEYDYSKACLDIRQQLEKQFNDSMLALKISIARMNRDFKG